MRAKKEDIKQPLLLDIFRRGENSFIIGIDKTSLDSLGKLQIIGGISRFSLLSGKNGLELSVETKCVLRDVLTFSKPPSPEAVPNFICKPQPHTLAAAGKIYLFHVFFGLAQFTEQPHALTCCKTKNAPEFAARSHYRCTAIFTDARSSAPLLSV